MINIKKSILTVGLVAAGITLVGCTDASVASRNLAKAAEMFELERRIVFYNGITNEYILTIEGRCSIQDVTNQVAITCKTGTNSFKKHHLGLSDNVTYFSEQLVSSDVNVYNYRVVFKPSVIMPDIEVK